MKLLEQIVKNDQNNSQKISGISIHVLFGSYILCRSQMSVSENYCLPSLFNYSHILAARDCHEGLFWVCLPLITQKKSVYIFTTKEVGT